MHNCSFHLVASKDAVWLRFPFVVMDSELEWALNGNSDFLCDVRTAGGECREATCPISDTQFVTRCKSLLLIGRLRRIILLIFLRFVGPGEAPAYAGTDFIIARDGRIAAVYLFFDKLP